MCAFEDPRTNELRPLAHSRWQRIGPILSLLLLAPVVSELLYGAMRVSVIFILIPEILIWGGGALLIRECVRRWNKGWASMLLLGIALAVAEEFVIQQTSIAPLIGSAAPAYGRVWGVNWVYCLWAIGYEAVWVVLIPVHLTELLFPARRRESWLRPRGIAIASLMFVLGAFMAWYGWTQRARVKVFHMQPYSPPASYLVLAMVSILLLILIAYALALPRQPEDGVGKTAPRPWLTGVIASALGLPWATLVLLGWGSSALPKIPFGFVLVCGVAWAGLTFFLMQRWTSGRNWNDAYRYAVVSGGIIACMLGGLLVFRVSGALRIDWIGKAVLNVAALVFLVEVGRSIGRRAPAEAQIR